MREYIVNRASSLAGRRTTYTPWLKGRQDYGAPPLWGHDITLSILLNVTLAGIIAAVTHYIDIQHVNVLALFVAMRQSVWR